MAQQYPPSGYVVLTYRILRILMAISILGFFWYRGFYAPVEDLPATALVIPFIPTMVPFLYRLIFREEHPQHLVLYLGAMVIFLLMQGVLYWPFTVFGLGALAGNLLISSLLAGSLRAAKPSEPTSTAIKVERQGMPLSLPAETGFQAVALQRYHAKIRRLETEERLGEEQLQAFQRQWKESDRETVRALRLEERMAHQELRLAHQRLIRRFYQQLLELVQRHGNLDLNCQRLEAALEARANHLDPRARLLSVDLQARLTQALNDLEKEDQ